MISFDINYFAVLISAIASMLVGFAWFSPVLFGDKWLVALGKSKVPTPSGEKSAMKKSMGKIYISSFIGSLATAFILALIIDASGAHTVADSIFVGLLIWFGFIVTTSISFMLYDRQILAQDVGSMKIHFLINISYHLVNISVMATILTLWT